MKKKFIGWLVLFLIMLSVASYVSAQCYVNGKEIPCDIFWVEYGWMFGLIGVPFIAIGLLMLFGTNWIIKLQVWWLKILGAELKPGIIIPKIYKAMGVIFLVIGIIFLCFFLFR